MSASLERVGGQRHGAAQRVHVGRLQPDIDSQGPRRGHRLFECLIRLGRCHELQRSSDALHLDQTGQGPPSPTSHSSAVDDSIIRVTMPAWNRTGRRR